MLKLIRHIVGRELGTSAAALRPTLKLKGPISSPPGSWLFQTLLQSNRGLDRDGENGEAPGWDVKKMGGS